MYVKVMENIVKYGEIVDCSVFSSITMEFGRIYREIMQIGLILYFKLLWNGIISCNINSYFCSCFIM